MKLSVLSATLLVIAFQGCGENSSFMTPEQQAQINKIEADRRAAKDFKCSVREVPGHTLGENPACVGNPSYTLLRAGK